jgi:hypothetical protein
MAQFPLGIKKVKQSNACCLCTWPNNNYLIDVSKKRMGSGQVIPAAGPGKY